MTERSNVNLPLQSLHTSAGMVLPVMEYVQYRQLVVGRNL